MEANDTGWREVALLLNGANEVLTDQIHRLSQEYARLQAQHKEMQDLKLIINKGLSLDN
jgi:hypothetical protein